jgi:hypothetical protein
MRKATFVGILVLAGMIPVADRADAYDAVDVKDGGAVAGEVKFVGSPPPRDKLAVNKDVEVCGKEEKLSETLVVGSNGGIQNAVVYLANISNGKPLNRTAQNGALDQNGCRYAPHVTLVPAKTSFNILNSDGILHNIHTYSTKNKPVNLAQPKFKKTITQQFEQPEFIKVGCDAHTWMSGWLVVQEHPYYAVTDQNGGFKLTDIPPGEYELKVWHETLGEKTQKVSVKPAAENKVVFELARK